jgi:hypothetical protein
VTRISTVWDRTLDVMRGRAGILTGIAALYVFLPAAINAVLRNVVAAPSPLALLAGLFGIATTLLLIFGVLAMTAVASDPAVGGADATRIAGRRFAAGLAVLAVLVVVVMLAFIVPAALLLSGGVTMNAAGTVDVSRASGPALGLGGLLLLAVFALAWWGSARLVPLFAVVVNERRGLGAFRRSVALTRGATLKLMGVILLYAVVLTVAIGAIGLVVGVIGALFFAAETGIPQILVGIAGAAGTAFATVVQTVFYTQFYVAAAGGGAAAVPADFPDA